MSRWFAEILVLLVVAVLMHRVWMHGLRLRGLFASKIDSRRVTPERLQLFIVTLVVAGWYLLQVLRSAGEAIPGIGGVWLRIFGLSCTVYAAGKAYRTAGVKSIGVEQDKEQQ